MARRLGLVPRAMLGYLFLSEARSRWHFDTLPPSAEVRAQAGAGPVLAEGERRMQEAFAGLLAHVHSRQWGRGAERRPARPQGGCWCRIIRQDKMEEERGLGERRETGLSALLSSCLRLFGRLGPRAEGSLA